MSNLLALTKTHDIIKQISRLNIQVQKELDPVGDPLFCYSIVDNSRNEKSIEVYKSYEEGVYFMISYLVHEEETFVLGVDLLEALELANMLGLDANHCDMAFDYIKESFNSGEIPVEIMAKMDECDLERFVCRKSMTEEAKDMYVMSRLLEN